MRLFIAEKPSMGREISKYLPEQKAIRKGDGFIVQGDDVVTWAFGHVLEQAEPGDYDERFQRWNAADLPIVPKDWKLLITKSSEKQFHLIKKLISEADTIVNAGDPDREGQLLIDEILIYVNNEKPVQRILLNALDEKSIRAALADLRDNKDFFNLQQSALARARADWLIGMNLSRAYTLAARRDGKKVTFPVGRVKTPTLALVVRRERELENFVPVDYYTLKVLYGHPNGNFWATWQLKDEQKGLDPDGRLLKRDIAEELAKQLQDDKTGIISKREKNKKKEPQRLPLSLSALQVLAGKAFGYDPQTVLDTAQKLYEKKLTTYPRSDCDYLPQNQYGDRNSILRNLSACGVPLIEEWAKGSDNTIKSRAWNDKKITAHHAIIPTTVAAKLPTLSEVERNIYQLIAQAYIAQFYPEHIYEQTKLTVTQLDEEFVAHGRVIVQEGWKALYKKKKNTDLDTKGKTAEENVSADSDNDSDADNENAEALEAGTLPNVKKGDGVTVENMAIDQKSTKPPSRFTAATLLQAMKEIHKYVKNEELKKQLKDISGIGTEATRATIISELISRGFLNETGKKKILQPTKEAYLLIDALPDEMVYPDETAVWEERLAKMSEGKDKLNSFLTDQVAFLERLIQKAATEHVESGEKLRTCPKCGKGTLSKRKGKFGEFYGCTNYPDCKYTEPVGGTDPNTGFNNIMVSTTTTITPNGQRGSWSQVGAGGAYGFANTAQDFTPIEVPEDKRQYQCPRCKVGYFVQVGDNKSQWICSNRGACKTTCVDVDGKPSIYANRR